MPSQPTNRRNGATFPPLCRPGGPLDLFITYCWQFFLLTQCLPIDLEYCFRLEQEVDTIIFGWILGAEHRDVAFNRGRNYGNMIRLILVEKGMYNLVVTGLAEWAKHCIELQLQGEEVMGYNGQMLRGRRRYLRPTAAIEMGFWEGMISALG